MTKEQIRAQLYVILRDIKDWSYIEDWDGDDEDGRPIIRQIYNGLTENDMKNIINKIEKLAREMN